MKKRFANLCKEDGKTFILAMDHAMIMNIGQRIQDPRKTVETAMNSGCDALLTNIGTAEYCLDLLNNKGLIIRGDAGTSTMHHSGNCFENSITTASVEAANALGADAYINMLFTHMPSGEQDERTLERSAKMADECRKYGMAYLIEAVPGGFVDPSVQTVDNVAFASRLSVEMGADAVKTVFTNTPDYEEKVVKTCFRPVIVLGGGTGKTHEALFKSTKDAMNSGCIGVAYGRLVWSDPKMPQLCRALSKIIHEDISVQEALEIMKE